MKKIIRSSAVVLSVCFFATTANAQLASDQPSQAAKAVEASKNRPVAKVTEVQTTSSAAAPRAVVIAKPVVTADVASPASTVDAVKAIEVQNAAVAVPVAAEAKLQPASAVAAPDAKKAIIQ